MIWNIPNTLTIFRLLAAPGVALVFLVLPRPMADIAAFTLFVGAALTDFLDGYLARAWGQESRFGAMLDPIADKAMVVIALAVVAAYVQPHLLFWVLLPASLILFREVFVSGLREFLGAEAGLLKVTKLAKWKTTVQMVSIGVLLLAGVFEHRFGMGTFGMDGQMVRAILSGEMPDESGLGRAYDLMIWSWYGGLALLWLAAALTIWTGWDYLRKAMPYLGEERA